MLTPEEHRRVRDLTLRETARLEDGVTGGSLAVEAFETIATTFYEGLTSCLVNVLGKQSAAEAIASTLLRHPTVAADVAAFVADQDRTPRPAKPLVVHRGMPTDCPVRAVHDSLLRTRDGRA